MESKFLLILSLIFATICITNAQNIEPHPCDICLKACNANPRGVDPNCIEACNTNLDCNGTVSPSTVTPTIPTTRSTSVSFVTTTPVSRSVIPITALPSTVQVLTSSAMLTSSTLTVQSTSTASTRPPRPTSTSILSPSSATKIYPTLGIVCFLWFVNVS